MGRALGLHSRPGHHPHARSLTDTVLACPNRTREPRRSSRTSPQPSSTSSSTWSSSTCSSSTCPLVISETFTLSLLTALLLKGVLEVVVVAKKRVVTRFRQASTPVGKVVAAILVWAVLFGSKFLVLESVALVFGPRVSLGGFFSVTALIVILMLSRAGVRRLLERSGSPA